MTTNSQPTVVVLGGGLSGVAAAYTLARAGARDITVLERGNRVGGLAGSFEREGHFYPLGYHHILDRDRVLLHFLDLIGALPDVRWRRVRMLFHLGGRAYDLGSPAGFLGFPMSLRDKAGFVRLMLKAFNKRDWSDWQDRSAADLVDRYAGEGTRVALFERLTQLKFELPCSEVSGAWLGARLHFREGSRPFGYIPGANWTKVLCDGVARPTCSRTWRYWWTSTRTTPSWRATRGTTSFRPLACRCRSMCAPPPRSRSGSSR